MPPRESSDGGPEVAADVIRLLEGQRDHYKAQVLDLQMEVRAALNGFSLIEGSEDAHARGVALEYARVCAIRNPWLGR